MCRSLKYPHSYSERKKKKVCHCVREHLAGVSCRFMWRRKSVSVCKTLSDETVSVCQIPNASIVECDMMIMWRTNFPPGLFFQECGYIFAPPDCSSKAGMACAFVPKPNSHIQVKKCQVEWRTQKHNINEKTLNKVRIHISEHQCSINPVANQSLRNRGLRGRSWRGLGRELTT